MNFSIHISISFYKYYTKFYFKNQMNFHIPRLFNHLSPEGRNTDWCFSTKRTIYKYHYQYQYHCVCKYLYFCRVFVLFVFLFVKYTFVCKLFVKIRSRNRLFSSFLYQIYVSFRRALHRSDKQNRFHKHFHLYLFVLFVKYLYCL